MHNGKSVSACLKNKSELKCLICNLGPKDMSKAHPKNINNSSDVKYSLSVFYACMDKGL